MTNLLTILTVFIIVLSACDDTTVKSSDLKQETNAANLRESELIIQSSQSVSPIEYSKWIISPENGLNKTKTISEFNYNLQLLPQEYLVCRTLKQKSITKAEYRMAAEDLEDLLYFTFKISVNKFHDEVLKYKLRDGNQYSARVDYCSFGMQQDISLKVGGAVIPCSSFHYERDYGASPIATFSVGFKKTSIPLEEDITFIYNDRMFNVGRVNITIRKTDIDYIPKLKLL